MTRKLTFLLGWLADPKIRFFVVVPQRKTVPILVRFAPNRARCNLSSICTCRYIVQKRLHPCKKDCYSESSFLFAAWRHALEFKFLQPSVQMLRGERSGSWGDARPAQGPAVGAPRHYRRSGLYTGAPERRYKVWSGDPDFIPDRASFLTYRPSVTF